MGLDLQAFAPYLAVIEIVLASVITALVILQSKGGGMDAVTGGDGGGFRTKRGLEAAMYRWTIYFSIAFFILTLFTFIAMGQASAAVSGL
ncbi:MAG: preprotein translocase subunit SecG [Chloroflexi bacterium]|nr:preprotein translocase subunit SecG [Chloroflexota bacterium]